MAKYYYDKFNAVELKVYVDNAPWDLVGYQDVAFETLNKGYTYNTTNNTYALNGIGWDGYTTISTGTVGYKVVQGKLHRFTAGTIAIAREPLSATLNVKDPSKNVPNITYSKGTLVQSNIIAENGAYPTDGRHSDGFWYVRGAIINTAPTVPGVFTAPTKGTILKKNEVIQVSWGASSDSESSVGLKYITEVEFNGSGVWATDINFLATSHPTTTSNFTVPSDSTKLLVRFRVKARDNTSLESAYRTSEQFQIIQNNPPTVSLTLPISNQTLYERDAFNIAGNAYDEDKDQSVTAYYQINNETRKVLATNLSQTQISISKQLTFKGGKLYDADTAVTDTLADGVAHTLKVWAVDNEGASSVVETRTFYVVPNRAPLLTVNNPTPNGIIDVDSFSISGTYSDADGNTTTVVYRINGGNSVQIAQGISGDFTFDVTLGSLQIGVNAITIEATDSYGAKTTKTVKLNKTKVATPITRSTVRYKVAPPTGTASEILVWVQRDTNLTLNASVSMTLSGEAESFVAMTKNATASLSDGRVEDEFYHQVAEAKDSIVLKFDLTKSSVDANEAITLITGVF